MSLSQLLLFQFMYCLAGLAYNAYAYRQIASGRKPPTPTPPLIGAMIMIIYGLCLVPGLIGHSVLYRALMLLSILVLGYGGVFQHILRFIREASAYSSVIAWALAVGINLFGLVLNVLAALGLFIPA